MRNRSDVEDSTVVALAAGMVAAQRDCTLDQAIACMKGRAAEMYRTLEEVAVAVAERRLQFR